MMQMTSRIATAYMIAILELVGFDPIGQGFLRDLSCKQLAKLRLFCLMSAGLERIKYGKVRVVVKNTMQED